MSVEGWWPDAAGLILKQLVEGRHRLLRFEVATGELQTIPTDSGVIWSARVRPDGRVWFLHEQGDRPRRVLGDGGGEVVQLQGEAAPEARPYTSWQFTNDRGNQVEGFVVT